MKMGPPSLRLVCLNPTPEQPTNSSVQGKPTGRFTTQLRNGRQGSPNQLAPNTENVYASLPKGRPPLSAHRRLNALYYNQSFSDTALPEIIQADGRIGDSSQLSMAAYILESQHKKSISLGQIAAQHNLVDETGKIPASKIPQLEQLAIDETVEPGETLSRQQVYDATRLIIHMVRQPSGDRFSAAEAASDAHIVRSDGTVTHKGVYAMLKKMEEESASQRAEIVKRKDFVTTDEEYPLLFQEVIRNVIYQMIHHDRFNGGASTEQIARNNGLRLEDLDPTVRVRLSQAEADRDHQDGGRGEPDRPLVDKAIELMWSGQLSFDDAKALELLFKVGESTIHPEVLKKLSQVAGDIEDRRY